MAVSEPVTQTVTIAAGASASTECASSGRMLIGIVMPSAFTGTALAVYAGSTAGNTLAAYDDVGAPIVAQVGTSRYVSMAWAKLVAPYISVASNATEAAARTLELIFGEA